MAKRECPVCMETLSERDHGTVTDDSLSCSNDHNVCTTCMSRLVRPCAQVAAALCYDCPICRQRFVLTPLHALVVLTRTWTSALEVFDSPEEVVRWQGRCVPVRKRRRQ